MHFAIFGASIAGCTAAILLKKNGHEVTIFEKKTDKNAYKVLCTHFIQPIATSAIRALEIEDFFKEKSQKSLAKFYTSIGIIEPVVAYAGNTHHNIYAYNMERSILDPFLKKLLDYYNINIVLNEKFKKISICEKHCEVFFENIAPLKYDYIIAADGRNSTISHFLKINREESDNDRATLFAYFSNTPFDDEQNQYSHFSTLNNEMGFIYPLKNNRVLLSWYFNKNQKFTYADKALCLIENMIRIFPQYSFDQLKLIGKVYGYKNYKNIHQLPVYKRVLFVGDAAASLDPMSGVGCGFAFHSSYLLVKSLVESSNHDDFTHKYLEQYKAEIFPHFSGIIGDSKIRNNLEMKNKVFTQLINDIELKKCYLNLTGRLICPLDFQKAYIKSLTQIKIKK